MIKEVLLAVVQAATEFLPVSSSGHLALFGMYFNDVNLFYITLLHLASVLAIIIYTRDELRNLCNITNKKVQQMWVYLALGVIPAGLCGLLFKDSIENAFSNPLGIGISFIFTGCILLTCYSFKHNTGELTNKRSFLVGLSQIIALFPGVSRSGTTISFGIFGGLKREVAFRYSFLIAIPLIIGSALIQFQFAALTAPMMVGFLVCFVLSYGALYVLEWTVKHNYFWAFGVYCLALGIILLSRSV